MLPPEKITADFLRMLEFIEKPLKLPSGFLNSLNQEGDWSFIIKCHALVEAGLSKLLSTVLDARLTKIFERLELGDTQMGKIVFAEALELIDQRQRKFIRQLSFLRNIVVHDIRNVNFQFSSYTQGLDSNQMNSFVDAITAFAPTQASAVTWREFARRDPRIAIWTSTWSFLLHTVTGSNKATIEKVRTRLLLQKAKDFDRVFAALNKKK